jgi:hypothetical protein
MNDEYRYKQFTTSLLFRDLRFRKDAATPGDTVPAFELISTDGSRLGNEDIFGEKSAATGPGAFHAVCSAFVWPNEPVT